MQCCSFKEMMIYYIPLSSEKYIGSSLRKARRGLKRGGNPTNPSLISILSCITPGPGLSPPLYGLEVIEASVAYCVFVFIAVVPSDEALPPVRQDLEAPSASVFVLLYSASVFVLLYPYKSNKSRVPRPLSRRLRRSSHPTHSRQHTLGVLATCAPTHRSMRTHIGTRTHT